MANDRVAAMARWDASPGQRNPCVQLHMAEHDLAVLHAALARTRAPASLGRQVSRGARPVSPAVSHRDTEPPADLPPGVVPFQPRHPSPASTKGKAEAGDGITTLVRPGPGLAGQRAATLPRALVLTLPTEAARRVLEHLRTAADMLAACEAALPADVAVFAAAVCDWRVAQPAPKKLKKTPGDAPPTLQFAENPDILTYLSGSGAERPELIVGFAAETENVIDNAKAKLARKGCDWIVANDVSLGTGTFAGDKNTVHLIMGDGREEWPTLSKTNVGTRLAQRIAEALGDGTGSPDATK